MTLPTKRQTLLTVINEAANIRIAVICPRAQAETVLGHIQARYYADYAMVVFLQELEILRPEKF